MNLFPTTYILFSSFLLLLRTTKAQEKFSSDILGNPNKFSTFFEETLPITEVEIYQYNNAAQSILLENGYAKYQFENNNDWPPQGLNVVPTEVTVIFTQYPKHKSFWLTDYHWLLAKRLEELFSLDSALNDTSIVYNIVMQTDCENEFEAMQLFHGIEVKYQVIVEEEVILEEEIESVTKAKTSGSSTQSKKVKRFMARQKYYTDSTVYTVLDRHPEWQNTVMVIDWTGSMYGYGAESVLWQAMNESKSGIEKIALFNDGDKKKNRKKELGRTGGIYIEKTTPISKTIKLFNRVKNKGTGGDSPENDVEAIATTLAASPQSESVILIADNQSCVRDFALINCIDKPVHVVLCGTHKGINAQYLNIAWRTGGSIHTKEWDLDNIQELVAQQNIVIEGIRYIRTIDNLLLPEDRFANRFGYCDRYYKAPRRKQKSKKRKEPQCYFTE